MEYILEASEAKALDKYTIQTIGIPSLVLMERAALACVEQIECDVCEKENKTALCIAGSGNNGADALAVARILAERKWQVTVLCAQPEKKSSEENQIQLAVLKNYPVTFISKLEDCEYTVIVDGIFGIGFHGKANQEIADILKIVNRKKAYRLAIDMPTGVNTDTGECEIGFQADVTVTFGYRKRGQVLFPGVQFAGNVIVKKIGLYENFFSEEMTPGLSTIQGNPAFAVPARRKDGNKGTFGKCLLAAGSDNYPGAALLASMACYRSGAGMVKVCTADSVKEALLSYAPEVLWDKTEHFSDSFSWCDAIVIGPGLGKTQAALQMLKEAVLNTDKPIVIDADGINLLAENKNLLDNLREQKKRQIILTPHIVEMVRLLNAAFSPDTYSVDTLKKDFITITKKLGDYLGCTVVAKDARTLIYEPGQIPCLNLWGNSGMAVAGCGDVLAGIAGAYLGRKLTAFEAAVTAVGCHAKAGDKASLLLGEDRAMPRDIIQAIESV